VLNELLGSDFNGTWAAAAFVVVLALAWLAAQIAARGVRAALLVFSSGVDQESFTSPIVRRPIRIIRAVVFLLVALTLAVPALEISGAKIDLGFGRQALLNWLFKSGLHVALIVLLAYGAIRIAGTVVTHLEDQLSRDPGPGGAERAKRARTMGRLIRNVANTVVSVIATLMVLHEFNINILPVLTGAGIAGLAVGFGAQTLVRDVISGFFLIFEDQVRVGDVATINGTSGLVEAINLRTIVLRDVAGTVHVFPNGAVQQMSNQTKDFSYAVIDMGVAYKEDTDAVTNVMMEVAEAMRGDPACGPNMLEPIEIMGVDAFAASQVTIKARLKTVPLKQWEIGREYRRRLKKAFDERGIEIPFPHMSVYFRDGGQPPAIRGAGPDATGSSATGPAATPKP
jgi:small conductance mechanosensitive channel